MTTWEMRGVKVKGGEEVDGEADERESGEKRHTVLEGGRMCCNADKEMRGRD